MSKGSGKGDRPRKVDAKAYANNYDRIFSKKENQQKKQEDIQCENTRIRLSR